MTKADISKIEWFIENELKGRELVLEYIRDLEDEDSNKYKAVFFGDFTENIEISIVFTAIDGWVFILNNDLEIKCDTREFWIILMSKLNEQ